MLEKGAGEARRGKVLIQTKRTANESLLARGVSSSDLAGVVDDTFSTRS